MGMTISSRKLHHRGMAGYFLLLGLTDFNADDKVTVAPVTAPLLRRRLCQHPAWPPARSSPSPRLSVQPGQWCVK
jgi:hypothetical protein